MKTVVIMQPQLFPWRGLFEQIRLADEFVHLDDAQFQKGGFTNRVQIKTASGPAWLTVPVLRSGSLPRIDECEIDYTSSWRERHVRTLAHAYARASHAAAMRRIVEDVYAVRPRTIAELDIAGIERCASELALRPRFSRASSTPVAGAKTERVLALLESRGASRYVTGLGARAYLDVELLAGHGIAVEVMEYRRTPYPQLHGAFDPHVSVLDLIANLGPEAASRLDSSAVPWADAHERADDAVAS